MGSNILYLVYSIPTFLHRLIVLTNFICLQRGVAIGKNGFYSLSDVHFHLSLSIDQGEKGRDGCMDFLTTGLSLEVS